MEWSLARACSARLIVLPVVALVLATAQLDDAHVRHFAESRYRSRASCRRSPRLAGRC
jgi:hypothetical protein